jgi:hypothetical protein
MSAEAVRVLRTFRCEGRLFRKGDIVSANDELVQRILVEHPSGLFGRRG